MEHIVKKVGAKRQGTSICATFRKEGEPILRAYEEAYLFGAMDVLKESFDCAAKWADMSLWELFELFLDVRYRTSVGAGMSLLDGRAQGEHD